MPGLGRLATCRCMQRSITSLEACTKKKVEVIISRPVPRLHMDSIPRPQLLAGHQGMLMQLPPHFYPPRDPNFRSDREHLSDLEHKLLEARQRVNLFSVSCKFFARNYCLLERERERSKMTLIARLVDVNERCCTLGHRLGSYPYPNPSLTRVKGLSDVGGC